MPMRELVKKLRKYQIQIRKAINNQMQGDFHSVFKGSGLEFDDVWFTYDADDGEVLRGVTLSIPKGSMTAIVGRSGAGKSTLMRILATVTKATTGFVKWDGVDIADSPNHLRKVLG